MKLNRLISLLAIPFMVASCSLFSYDNFDGPTETMSGSIVDMDGNPIQVETGGGARIKILDYGYADNPQEMYLSVKNDGTFINTKIFNSVYTVVAEGPFVPLIQYDAHSNIVSDKSLKNVTKKNFQGMRFEVEPYLILNWTSEPTVNPDGSITVNFSFNRGTDNSEYHKKIKDVTLFVSTTKYVGNGDMDKRFTTAIKGAEANNMLGMDNTMTTPALIPGRPYYVRVGARMDYTGPWGSSNYNYTTVAKVVVPKPSVE